MRNLLYIVLVIAVGAFISMYLGYLRENNTTKQDNLIRVQTPKPDETVGSPLTVKGEARGNWYFEADFPVSVLDADGRQLAIAPAQAQGEWMTEEFVPFEVTLTFIPTTQTGTIVLSKHNASGLPEHNDERRIPVKFDLSAGAKREIKLYYYNQEKDKDASGNIMCSAQGLVEVTREIPSTITPIQDSVRLLLKGELTSQERAQGIETEYPLSGLNLTSASLKDAVLTLAFDDPEFKTGGGSCRVGILWAQIEATAKQFPGVSEVRAMPEDLFQP